VEANDCLGQAADHDSTAGGPSVLRANMNTSETMPIGKRKVGRPALSKSKAKALITPIRLQQRERASFERAARQAGLSLSEWLRQAAWLAQGFDTIIWQNGDDLGRANTRKLTIRFTDGTQASHELWANETQTEYASDEIPTEWQQHRIREVRVNTRQRGKSFISIYIEGRDEPLTVLKRY
jgi:hypothetical protein